MTRSDPPSEQGESPDGTGPRTMYSAQRDQHIMRTLRASGRVDVSDMARQLDVTGETVRKDLVRLERQGFLRRVHGGAIPIGSIIEPDVSRRVEYSFEKDRIARAATAHLPDSGSVLIDAGSTTARMAEHFPEDKALTVFTNSLPIAQTLLSRPHVTVFVVGGRLRSQSVATVGGWATRMMSEVNVDVAFLGTNGISFERGLTTPDADEGDVKQLMVARARRRILLTDRSKFDLVSMCTYAELADIDLLITDSGLRPEHSKALEARGITVEKV
jgi:DeoR family transcriptional regulator, fructose operon transcriptional repressor